MQQPPPRCTYQAGRATPQKTVRMTTVPDQAPTPGPGRQDRSTLLPRQAQRQHVRPAAQSAQRTQWSPRSNPDHEGTCMGEDPSALLAAAAAGDGAAWNAIVEQYTGL